MLHLFLLTFCALARSSAQLSSFPLDDMSPFGLDQGESDLDPFFDENLSPSSSYEPDSLAGWPDDLFDAPETDASTPPFSDFSSLPPSGDGGADMITALNGCQSNPTQAKKLRSREEENQCFNNPAPKITLADMLNEQIKRKWCSGLPRLDFGNIPVVRFTNSYIFPVQPGALPDVPSSSIPLSGFYTVMKAALRKWIYSARSWEPSKPSHD